MVNINQTEPNNTPPEKVLRIHIVKAPDKLGDCISKFALVGILIIILAWCSLIFLSIILH